MAELQEELPVAKMNRSVSTDEVVGQQALELAWVGQQYSWCIVVDRCLAGTTADIEIWPVIQQRLVDSTAEVVEADKAAGTVVLRAKIHVKCWKTMTERWMLRLAVVRVQLLLMKFLAAEGWSNMRPVTGCRPAVGVDTHQSRMTGPNLSH